LLQVHATVVSHTAHGTSTTDIVDNGKDTCLKVAGQSQFRCLGRSIASSVLMYANDNPATLVDSLGLCSQGTSSDDVYTGAGAGAGAGDTALKT